MIRAKFLFAALLLAVAAPAAAQSFTPSYTLQWTGSQKVEQIIGDVDWTTGAPTASATYLNYKVLANGLGYSFEHFNPAKGRSELIFLFGDTAAFGTVSAPPGLDCHAVPVGALVSVTANPCPAPPSLTNFQCLTSPTDATVEPCGKSAYDFQAQDPLAISDSTDPDAGLVLRFLMNGDLPQFVTPTPLMTAPKPVPIATGGDDIPNSGIALGDQIYIVYSTGSNPSCTSPCDVYANAFSVLVRFDEATRTFTTLRELSSIPAGGHFLYTTMHEVGPGYGGAASNAPAVLMFGTGDYRQSNIYLAVVPREHFADGIGTRYLIGLDHGRPVWTDPATTTQQAMDDQTKAVPVIVDNAPSPSIGNISVSYVPQLDLWLMTYNADGTNPPATRSVFLRYASAPWGPWSEPLTIFNDCADGAFGTFVHYVNTSGGDCPRADPSPAGVAGPMISENGGANDPQTSRGGSFAPSIIERFTRISNGRLSIYYTLSTWNPYTVVRMRSDFKIGFLPRW